MKIVEKYSKRRIAMKTWGCIIAILGAVLVMFASNRVDSLGLVARTIGIVFVFGSGCIFLASEIDFD